MKMNLKTCTVHIHLNCTTIMISFNLQHICIIHEKDEYIQICRGGNKKCNLKAIYIEL